MQFNNLLSLFELLIQLGAQLLLNVIQINTCLALTFTLTVLVETTQAVVSADDEKSSVGRRNKLCIGHLK